MKRLFVKSVFLALTSFGIFVTMIAFQMYSPLYYLGSLTYLLIGIIAPDIRENRSAMSILFSPFIFVFLVALPTPIGNPALFPWIVPIAPAIYLTSFLLGANISAERFSAKALPSMVGFIAIVIVSTFLILPYALKISVKIMNLADAKRKAYEVNRVKAALSSSLRSLDNDYDFGRIELTKTVSYKCTIYNDDIRPLKIKDVKTSCNCIVSDYSKKAAIKGQFVEIDVVFTPEQKGEVLRTIVVETTDSKNPFRIFQLKGVVV